MRIILNRINIFLVILYIVVVLPLWAGLLRDSHFSFPGLHGINPAIAAERQKIRQQSKIKVLNLLMPSGYADLVDLSRSRRDPESVDLDKYIGYYAQAAAVLPVPFSADAHAMLGFCYYHEGKIKESYESYLRALEENPAFIWTYNNLALLQFKQGDYPKAAALLEQGLKSDPQTSVKVLASSKIYADIMRDAKDGVDLPAELKSAYSDAARMLVISLYRMGKFPETISAAQYAVTSGFEPAAVFYYYAGAALEASGDHLKAQEFLKAVGPGHEHEDVFTGQDLAARIF